MRGEMFVCVQAKAPFQLGKGIGRQRKTDGKGMPAKAREQIRAAFDCMQQLKAIDRSPRPVSHPLLNAHHDRRLRRPLHHARGKNTDDPAMPAIAIDHQQSIGAQLSIFSEPLFNHRQRERLSLAPLPVEPLQLRG